VGDFAVVSALDGDCGQAVGHGPGNGGVGQGDLEGDAIVLRGPGLCG